MSRTRAVLVAMAGVLLVLVGSAPASAHLALAGANPAPGEVLATVPAEASLTFTERLGSSVEVRVLGPGGGLASTGQVSVRGRTARIAVTDQGPGEYLVAYRVVSGDGHLLTHRISFTVAGTPEASTDPAGPAADLETDSKTDPAGTSDDAPGMLPVVAGAAVILGATGAGVLLIRRRRTG